MANCRFGLDLIMAILPQSALTEATLQVLCMNARIRLLWRLWSCCRAFFTRFADSVVFQ